MKYVLVCSVLLTLFLSCARKDEFISLEGMNEVPVQIFKVNTSKDTIIVGAKGTNLKFQSNCFSDSAGNIIQGEVAIELREFYTPKDFIENRLTTLTTDGKVLSSSGMVHLTAKFGNASLTIAKGKDFEISFLKIQKHGEAKLFKGFVGRDGFVRWQLALSDTVFLRIQTITQKVYGVEDINEELFAIINGDTTKQSEKRMQLFLTQKGIDSISNSTNALRSNYYSFNSTMLGYLNCDIFIEQDVTSFIVELDGEWNKPEVLLVLDSLNSVLSPVQVDSTLNEFYFSLPHSKKLTVLVHALKNNKHWFGQTRTNSNEGVVQVTLTETANEIIKQRIKALH